jgi:hypothetical protein
LRFRFVPAVGVGIPFSGSRLAIARTWHLPLQKRWSLYAALDINRQDQATRA